MNTEQAIKEALKTVRERKERNDFALHGNRQRAMSSKACAALIDEIRSYTIDLGQAQTTADRSRLVKLRENAQAELDKELAAIGLYSSALQPTYFCDRCRDSGYVNGKLCDCVNKLVRVLLLKSVNVNPDFTFENSTAESANSRAFAKCAEIAEGKTEKRNLLLIGKSGRGKTYLLNAMANRLIEREADFIFMRAFELNRLFLEIHLAQNADKSGFWNELLRVETLIIDDLGSEQAYNNVTLPSLYNLIDERNYNQKATWISGNLAMDEFSARYGERIFSRLCDKRLTYVIELCGRDFRTGLV
ncbi:MAG: ATP-binding protein [Clostridia bacterium]|nr:ATP-binding protein [Clostridia bacterium]